jgi:hypothetical protein
VCPIKNREGIGLTEQSRVVGFHKKWEGSKMAIKEKVLGWEIENRGTRQFVIGLQDYISGGNARVNEVAGKKANVTIFPDTIVRVTPECAEKMTRDWPKEIRILRRSTERG